jgi:predicted DNA-binding protein (UPF0251 family)
MRKKLNSKALVALVVLVAALSVGVAAASAHGGPGGGGPGGGGPGGRGPGGGSVSSLVTQAAKELSVSRATLVKAIEDAAATRIDAAVTDGDLTATRAADLKEEVQDNLNAAYSISETKTVATNLGITTAALNTGFKSARTTVATAQIDARLADGDITATQAADLKTKLASATLPGYKGGGGLGFGH